jgi:tetratricopeptide (TPR) repeat protein
VLVAFAAGLLAKPMVVTLPFALLLLDVWPLGRIGLELPTWQRWKGPVLEKLPLLALAVMVSGLTFLAQSRGGAVAPFVTEALPGRIVNAVLSYAGYLGMTFWPRGLAVFYPHPDVLSPWQTGFAVLLLATVTGVSVWQARRAPWLLVGWLWYLGTLVPVAGIVRAGDQAMADRFTYVPHVGLLIAIVWGVATWIPRGRARRLLPAAAAVAIAASVLTTRLQLRHWRDSLALFGHALAVTERNGVAHTNYGFALLELGRAEEALAHFQEAVAIEPRHVKARMNLGYGLATVGRSEEAIVEYHEAIRLGPGHAPSHYNLGLELAERGQLDEAVAQYREALRLDPAYVKAHNNLGLVLASRGQLAEALVHYQAALALDPGLAAAHNNAAVVLERLGRADDALAHYREAVRLTPDDARAHFNLGAVLGGGDRLGEAAAAFREALRLRPDLAEGNLALGDVLAKQGRGADALAEYRLALNARPEWVPAETRVAWAIASGSGADGDAAEAVRLAEHARDATNGEDPDVLRSLAAAYAAAGRFREAGEVARRTLVLARAAGREPLAAEVEQHLAAYTAGRALR